MAEQTLKLENDFPFESKLNLGSLVAYWENNLNSNNVLAGYPADEIKALIKSAPELRKPITNFDVLKKHGPLVGMLMSVVLPPAMISVELSAALIPFHFKGFYASPAYLKVLPFDQVREDLTVNMPNNDMRAGKIIRACAEILNKFYGADIEIDEPILLTIPNENGLKKIYKVELNLQFVDVLSKGELEPISKKTIRKLLDNMSDGEMWLKHIKPENFEFQGFTICKLVDVTVEEMLSDIKYDLLKKDAVVCGHNFLNIQQKIRSIFKLPDLKLGLAYFDPNNNIIKNNSANDWNSFVVSEDNHVVTRDHLKGSIYDEAYDTKRPVIIEDLEELDSKTHIENSLLQRGIKNMVIAPLVYDEEVIGILELGNPDVSKLNTISAGKLNNVLPMFTASVRRVLREMHTEVRALIQEECTAIHPSVEWKFLEEGFNILNRRNKKDRSPLRSIVFNEVYPIYGLSDIRNSSIERNIAIQEDLRTNLKEAKKLVSTLLEYKKMPVLGEIHYRAELELQKINNVLDSGDESSIINFLKIEVQPVLEHFKNDDPLLRPIIENYEKLLDPKLGFVYDKRRDFEYSLTKVNDTISNYLDHVEKQSQEIFPHYFEKYKTDGVEYNIYLGGSLVKDRTYNQVYLQNFRLWQLTTMCEIAATVELAKADLPKKLDIAQLILVHSDPLSIRFRKDEKHFDVDGAYNIRYEIVKKRIDKAYIKSTDERLTQPGKISIVYANQQEVKEYEKYIQYLESISYLIKGSTEYLELEELPGAQGLKALRVKVNLKSEPKQFGGEVLNDIFDVVNV